MNKKSQEEMVGFVMVVVVVAVIFLVFLGIAVRKPGVSQDRTQVTEVSQFLDAMLEFTTECEVSSVPLNFKDLIIKAYEGGLCENPIETPQTILERTSEKIIEASWQIGDGMRYRGYNISAKYEKTGSPIHTVFSKQSFPGGGAVPDEREAKTAEKPIGKGITVKFTIYENLG